MTAFDDAETGAWTLANFAKAFEFYSRDILFTVVIVGLSTVLIGIFAAAIGGFLVLSDRPVRVARRLQRNVELFVSAQRA